MWIDERGSQVLELAECRRLLALGAKQHRHGHLGVADGDGAPTVLPVNYVMSGLDVVILVGEGLFRHLENRLVAFEVDGADGAENVPAGGGATAWSVLVKGLALEQEGPAPSSILPALLVAEPGHRVVRIRTDVLTGRRLASRDGGEGAGPGASGHASARAN